MEELELTGPIAIAQKFYSSVTIFDWTLSVLDFCLFEGIFNVEILINILQSWIVYHSSCLLFVVRLVFQNNLDLPW